MRACRNIALNAGHNVRVKPPRPTKPRSRVGEARWEFIGALDYDAPPRISASITCARRTMMSRCQVAVAAHISRAPRCLRWSNACAIRTRGLSLPAPANAEFASICAAGHAPTLASGWASHAHATAARGSQSDGQNNLSGTSAQHFATISTHSSRALICDALCNFDVHNTNSPSRCRVPHVGGGCNHCARLGCAAFPYRVCDPGRQSNVSAPHCMQNLLRFAGAPALFNQMLALAWPAPGNTEHMRSKSQNTRASDTGDSAPW